MRFEKGNLWDFHAQGWKIVISTNIGWGATLHVGGNQQRHANNMGAGIALQTMQRWPWLPEWLGSHYRARHLQGAPQRPLEHDALRLIFVPVKPLLESDPAYSWNQDASIPLIAAQLGMLSAHTGKIALGYIGCGNGGAKQAAVLPYLLKLEIVRNHLGHGETIVVDRAPIL